MRGHRKIRNLYNIAERIWKLEQKTASKSDVAHCCALRTCVNFADRKFDGCAVADFYRARKQFPHLIHGTCADILFRNLQATMNKSIHSSISLESLGLEECNGTYRDERTLRKK